jgi:hypothetical protein
MQRAPNMKHSRWIVAIMVLSLTVLWSFGGLWLASAQNNGAICVLKIASKSNKILSILVNEPQNFNIAIPLPISKVVNVPILCGGLGTLALGIANQDANSVKVTAQVFTNEGILICSKGPFIMNAHGSQGTTFTDCQ